MKKTWWKPIFLLFIIGTLITCIEPYNQQIGKIESLLVVDALLTDENASNYVRISKSASTAGHKTEMVTGAQVTITDNNGITALFTEKGDGVYKSDSLVFRGEIGHLYTLHIRTADGFEYESDECLLNPVQDIDRIYYKPDESIIDNEIKSGLRLYVKSKSTTDCGYNRWMYHEWWKVEALYAQEAVYVDSLTFLPSTPYKRICYANKKSSEIIIKSTQENIDQPLLFISSKDSPRLLVEYCLELKQLSLSKEEYEFWNCMKQIGESGSNIFDKQPFQISGNIHNVNNPDQTVLGYFQVSAVKMKREYITYDQAKAAGVSRYIYPCDVVQAERTLELPNWDKVYNYYIRSGFTFVRPVFRPGGLSAMMFVTPLCGDCTLSGTLNKPDFWVDLQ
jgi:hypothetical protein